MSKELENLWEVVRSIPRGKVASYGDVGRALKHPTTGFQVGRWMAHAPEGVPWWRVVAATGQLPIAKLNPQYADVQRTRLEQEGVEFEGEAIGRGCFWRP